MEVDALNIPNSKPPLRVTVGDEAFPLKRYLLRPYPGVSTRNYESKKTDSYRLSRARRVVGNAFGILNQKRRFFVAEFDCRANADKNVGCLCVDKHCENSLRVTPRGSRKKPKLGTWPTGRGHMAVVNSHVMPCCAVALRNRLPGGMVRAR